MTTALRSSNISAMITSKPFARFITVFPVLVLAFLAFDYYGMVPGFRQNHLITPANYGRNVRVAVVNANGWHDEVTSSVLSAFGQLSECEVHVYLGATRFGISDVYAQLPGSQRRTIKPKEEVTETLEASKRPDIIVTITTEDDFYKDNTMKETLKSHIDQPDGPSLFAIMHDTSVWGDVKNRLPPLKPWMEKGKIHILTLSNHIRDGIRKELDEKWSAETTVSGVAIDTFPPVFAVPSAYLSKPNNDTLKFAIQGDINRADRPPTRDLTASIEHFAKLLQTHGTAAPRLELDFVGQGRQPDMPESMKSHSTHYHDIPFDEFYSTLHGMSALLPAFLPDTVYLKQRATSSIPAHLIGGVPLIADQAILDKYGYLRKEEVYFRREGENEVDVIARIAEMPYEERASMVKRVEEARERLVQGNALMIRGFIAKTMAKKSP